MEVLLYLVVLNVLAIDLGLIFYMLSIKKFASKMNNLDISKIDLGGKNE